MQIEPSAVQWRQTEQGLRPFFQDDGGDFYEIAWCAQPGSQQAFLECPLQEVLYEGTRGPGKTDALLMDFAQHCGPDERSEEERRYGVKKQRGWGAEWKGVLFRRTYPELADVIDKSKKWFKAFCPEARYNEAKSVWTWPTGEKLLFRHFPRQSTYWSYHGHAYPWIGWEELTTWPDDKCFKSMFSCSRSPIPGIPIKIRGTTNPFGVGHNWVKIRYDLPVPAGRLYGRVIRDSVDDYGIPEPPRVAIHGQLNENKVLLSADPTYISRLAASAPSPAAREAWIMGSWDIVAGGMFDDIWYYAKKYAVLPDFVPPKEWHVDRAFDWGDSKPFAVGWFAESNGEDLTLPSGRVMQTVPGDLFMFAEWYGWNGRPNEGCKLVDTKIAEGIVRRELILGVHGRVMPGPADSQIFNDSLPGETETNDTSIATNMAKHVRVDGKQYPGVRWVAAKKGPGSRVLGWQLIRSKLAATVPTKGGAREKPGLFICRRCRHWLRTVPVLPRDELNDQDVDTESEDHDGDMTRYRCLHRRRMRKVGRTVGGH